eukprot:scaffold36316_cov114-Isochrysis_galbana.AAC.3
MQAPRTGMGQEGGPVVECGRIWLGGFKAPPRGACAEAGEATLGSVVGWPLHRDPAFRVTLIEPNGGS